MLYHINFASIVSFQVVGWFLLLMASKQLTDAMNEGFPIGHIKATCKIVGKKVQYNAAALHLLNEHGT